MRKRLGTALAAGLLVATSACAPAPRFVFASFPVRQDVMYYDLGLMVSGRLASDNGCLVLDGTSQGRVLIVLATPYYRVDGEVLRYERPGRRDEWRLGDPFDVREFRKDEYEHAQAVIPAGCPQDLPRLTTSIHSGRHTPR